MKTSIMAGATLLAVACQASGPTPVDTRPSSIVRDSAGIEIVENYSPVWPRGEGWVVDSAPALTIANPPEGDRRFSMTEISSVARLADGRYVVACHKSREVQLFDRQGMFVRLIGRLGEGPGEFQMPESVSVIGDTILVASGGGYFGPVNFFDSLGRVLRTESSTNTALSKAVGPGHNWENRDFLPDGSAIAHVIGSEAVYQAMQPGEVYRSHATFYRVTRTGQVDSLGTFVSGVQQKPKPGRSSFLGGMPLFQIRAFVAGGGEPLRIYAGSGESRDISVYDSAGKLVRIIRRMNLPTPIDEKTRTAQEGLNLSIARTADDSAAMRESFNGKLRLDSFPTLDAMHVDALGNLWTLNHQGWQVFDTAGRWLGGPHGARSNLSVIGADFISVIRRDRDGLESVVEYKLKKK